LVTTTSTLAGEWAGAVAEIFELLVAVTLVAATPPNLTDAPAVNPFPLIVTEVPPPLGPVLGLIAEIDGAGALVV